MASFSFKTVISYFPSTGSSAQKVNDQTETSYTPTEGYNVRDELLLDVGATNSQVAFASDVAALYLEETTGAAEGVMVRIGATDATPLRCKRLLVEPVTIDTVGMAAGSIYLTNESVNQIKVAITRFNTVA